jgi:dTMP kinase
VIISFEGGEGAGKSTHAALLKDYLQNQGRRVTQLREPGGSNISESIRTLFLNHQMDTMTELLLLLAARCENIKTIIEPAVKDGSIVIIDRFIDSTIVYQGIAGGLGIDKVKELMKLSGTWLIPDITILLDIEYEKALSRYSPSDRFECRNIDYHNKIRHGFLDICHEKRHIQINSDAPEQTIFDKIVKTVNL